MTSSKESVVVPRSRGQLIAAEGKKAREAAAADLLAKEAEAIELRRSLEVNNAKLAEAQQQQAELMRRQRTLDAEKRELDLTVEKRVQATPIFANRRERRISRSAWQPSGRFTTFRRKHCCRRATGTHLPFPFIWRPPPSTAGRRVSWCWTM